MKRIAVLTLVMVLLNVGIAFSEIRFAVPDFPPYMLEKGGRVQGLGVDAVSKIMKEINTPYSMTISNYGRAVQEVKSGKADGFFLATKNAERDAIAVLSDTVMLNRWCWFLPAGSTFDPKSPSFKEKAKIGTQLNSNTHKWLTDKGYKVIGTPAHAEQLPNLLLKANNVDAVFLAEAVFTDAAQKSGFSDEKYKVVLQEEKPFGIYISKTYLANNPGFMEKLNGAIKKLKK